jgi:hypothetical protein
MKIKTFTAIAVLIFILFDLNAQSTYLIEVILTFTKFKY